ncbi:hypothetical protein HDU84_002924 [Entophlyctis sp. JEL0112]|nr:hypothetical protein HDU84_002924 [Entophlyctis sp. JEL0112]
MALLYSEDDLFLIHADLSTSNSARIHLHRAYDNKPNVFVVDKLNSSRSKWGSIDLLRAEVTLVRTALLLKHPWSVLVMLDGSTFPLQSASVIKRALEPIARQNSTVLFGAFRDKPKMLDQCDSNYASSSICWEHAWRKALRRGKTTPNNYPVYKGSQWIVLSRQAAEYAVTESVAEPWLDFFGSAFAPDEFFFQSVLANAGWSRVDGFRLVFKIHSDQGCRSFKPSRSPGFGPCTLGENDWDEISRAQKDGFLFARKFLAKDSVKKLIVENYSDDR